MPKKVHGRQSKQRARSRRTAPAAPAGTPSYEEPAVAAATSAVTSASARPATPRPATPRAPGRRTPGIVVDYAYLRRDLMMLGALGPAMVVLLIIAYLVFHGA